MFRLSPRRSQRNKGFKVRHALQLCLLLAVGIWLVYQLQHSKNKKVEYEGSTNVKEKLQIGDDTIKLGRKDLQPRVNDTVNKDESHKEQEEEEETKPEEHLHSQENAEEETERRTGNEDKEIKDMGDDNTEKESKDIAEDSKGEERQEDEDQGGEVNESKEEEQEENKKDQSREQTELNQENESVEKDVKAEKGESHENGGDGTNEVQSEDKQNKEREREEGKELESENKVNEMKKDESNGMGTQEIEREDSKENEVKIEDSGPSENPLYDGNAKKNEDGGGETLKEESSTADMVQNSENMSENGRTEHLGGEAHSHGKVEENSLNSMETTNAVQNDSGSNVKESESMEKTGSSDVANEGKGIETNLRETGDSPSPSTTRTIEYNMAAGNEDQKDKVANDIAGEDSGQTVPNEQAEKNDSVDGDKQSDLSLTSFKTANKNPANGPSSDSFGTIEAVVSSSDNVPSSALEGTEGFEKSDTNPTPSQTVEKTDLASAKGIDSSNNTESVVSNGNKIDVIAQNSGINPVATTTIQKKDKPPKENGNVESNPNQSVDSVNSQVENAADEDISADQHSEMDSSSSSIPREEREARTDLGTLPETDSSGNNHQDAAAK